MADLSYQPKFEEGDMFTLESKFHTVMGVRETDEVEYRLSVNGRDRWKSASLIDRDAKLYDPDES
jgi:hypothetical protein